VRRCFECLNAFEMLLNVFLNALRVFERFAGSRKKCEKLRELARKKRLRTLTRTLNAENN